MTLQTNLYKYQRQLIDVVNIFADYLDCVDIAHSLDIQDRLQIDSITIGDRVFARHSTLDVDSRDTIDSNREMLHNAKNSLYLALVEYTNYNNPWGSITGVRPTALAYKMLDSIHYKHSEYANYSSLQELLHGRYFVREDKAEIISNIISTQSRALQIYLDSVLGVACKNSSIETTIDTSVIYDSATAMQEYVNLYVHIPYCPTRCSYCSFITTNIVNNALKSRYVDALVQEIKLTLELLASHGKRVLSIYIGGGTPSSLDRADIERLLQSLQGQRVEFSFEAGRTDTIDQALLDILQANGVSRICINPQSMVDSTLQRIGRGRTNAKQIIDVYKLARQYSMDINMDVIAGLEGENSADFVYTVDAITDLAPSNITMHTLCLKRGASNTSVHNSDISDMVDYAYNRLAGRGYKPYYLYKQKNSIGNLENCGFALVGKECVNNITTMEDMVAVVGAGAGAISKIFVGNGKIKRVPLPNDVKLYLDRHESILNDKYNLVIKHT